MPWQQGPGMSKEANWCPTPQSYAKSPGYAKSFVMPYEVRHNHHMRQVDLEKFDFSKPGNLVRLPLGSDNQCYISDGVLGRRLTKPKHLPYFRLPAAALCRRASSMLTIIPFIEQQNNNLSLSRVIS